MANQNKADIEQAKNAAVERMTESDIRYLESLEIRQVRFGVNEIYRARYDPQKLILYILDENGIPTGEKRRLKKSLPPQPTPASLIQSSIPQTPQPKEAADTSDKPDKKKALFDFSLKKKKAPAKQTSAPGDDSEDDDEEGNEESAKLEKTTPRVLISVFALIVLMLLCVFWVWMSFRPSSQTPPAEQPQIERLENLTMVGMRVNRDLLPGEKITDADIEKVSFSADIYNQAAFNGVTPLTWDTLPNVVGLYVNQFVHEGQILASNMVTGIYNNALNPFKPANDSNYVYLEIPVNFTYKHLDSVTIGKKMNFSIETKTFTDKNQSIGSEEVAGLEHTSSITEQTLTDIYRLKNVPVVDLIALDGSSLFDVYSIYNQIPDGDLQTYLQKVMEEEFFAAKELEELNGEDLTAENYFKKFSVAKIVIRLPAEQGAAIKKLTPQNTYVTISEGDGEYFCETDTQKSFITESLFTVKTLIEFLDGLK